MRIKCDWNIQLRNRCWEVTLAFGQTESSGVTPRSVWITQVHQEAPVRSIHQKQVQCVRKGSDVTDPVLYIDPDIKQGPPAVLTLAYIIKKKKKSHKVLRATWRKQHIHASRSRTEQLVCLSWTGVRSVLLACSSVSLSERGLGPSVSEWRNAGDEMWSWGPGSEQWLTEVLRGWTSRQRSSPQSGFCLLMASVQVSLSPRKSETVK